ncbi:type I restriction endonuclease [Shewanella algae]|uniref:type I restriction endonuclease n=1 Tax=Shewanella algae TaxID=38313 RepID=UPI001C58CE22|nr:type I restriction endonuclease [Shewanella algae]
MWTLEGLSNESDVEQKFIYPLLTCTKPEGLGIPSRNIHTKQNIKRLDIGKGAETKLYFPDYVCICLGLPALVIEAKSPGTPLTEGYREARLYSQEINAIWGSGISPVKYVIATNGEEIWFGYSDESEPKYKFDLSGATLYSEAIGTLLEFMSWDKISSYITEVQLSLKPSGLYKPRKLVGGKSISEQEVPLNKFGVTLVSSIKHIFNPETEEEREFIVKNAYVSSKRRERYIDPIDRVVKLSRPPSISKAQTLDNSEEPSELIDRISNGTNVEHQVLLLIGGVGSGKTTFIDYLKFVALQKYEVSTGWCRINMNNAPVNREEIYNWVRSKIIDEVKNSFKGVDFDDFENAKLLFSSEYNQFKKRFSTLLNEDSFEFKTKLAEKLDEWFSDQAILTKAFLRYSCGERGKLSIIVLDNCDKKNKDEQLLMFEVAQWIRDEFKSLVILPLRDETFDNHRDQPPLDTVLKDMVFRIEPPLFQQVLMRRIKLALSKISNGGENKLKFPLQNGFYVEYPRNDQAFYLTSIIKSLFDYDRFARRMIVGLAGRNMRRALEIFLEFCSSGYISEDQIFKIRQSEGKVNLPFHQVATVLIRMNKRFYNSDSSYIKSLFSSTEDDIVPAYLSRLLILSYLRENFKKKGVANIPGYFRKSNIKNDIVKFGITSEIIDKDLNSLLKAKCIITENLGENTVEEDDLVKIAPAGFVHLDLLENITYLSAVSEDTFFNDRNQAERIAGRIRDEKSHLHKINSIENARELLDFLTEIKSSLKKSLKNFDGVELFEHLTKFEVGYKAIERMELNANDDPWFNADKILPRRSYHEALIVNQEHYGYFAELPIGLTGLIHTTGLNGITPSIGDRVRVQVQWVDVIKRKMSLKLVSILEEDVGDLRIEIS